MHTVSVIKVLDVSSFSGLARAVKERYPSARLQLGEERGVVWIVIPDVSWHVGHGSFFQDLRHAGLIGGWSHKRYSDQEEVGV